MKQTITITITTATTNISSLIDGTSITNIVNNMENPTVGNLWKWFCSPLIHKTQHFQ